MSLNLQTVLNTHEDRLDQKRGYDESEAEMVALKRIGGGSRPILHGEFDSVKANIQAHFIRNPLDNPSRGSVGSNHEDPGYPEAPEAFLLTEVLQEALADLKGLSVNPTPSRWFDPCIECHRDADCSCIVEWAGDLPHGTHRKDKPGPQYTPNIGRKKRGTLGFDFDHLKCPNSHTYQECAARWFGSSCEEPWSFVWICRYLDLDEDYFRKRFGIGANAPRSEIS